MFFLTFGSEVLKSPTATVEASLSSLKSMPASYVLGFFSVFMFITTLSFWLIDLFINIYQTVVLEKTLESPLDSKENKPVNPKGNQPWIFIERTEEKLHYFGHLTQRGDLMEKTLMLGKTEGRKRRVWQGMRWLVSIIESMDINLNKLLETVKNGEPCSPQGHKELDTT